MTRKLQTCNSAEEHIVPDFKNTRTQSTTPQDSTLSHSFTEHSRTQEQEHKNTRATERKKWNELFSSLSHVPPLPLQRSDALGKGIEFIFFIQSYPGDKRTCSYGNTDLMKIPCRHAIKAGFHVCREPHTLTDLMYTTGAWREGYQENINPIDVPEDAWSIPEDVEEVNVLPPDTRRSVGRKRKRRYESAEDKIRSSQTSQKRQPRKCSRCGMSGHNKATCKIPI
ncbi:hypothetical protein DY000_02047069 [Brassica cretica]|uniref:SWIM-type domain-containing protein n=1 Tax=Brassica cretica TaxID=69181 RepID=A0ABQ7F111_BRACR|nr:hypothetical protein DY000_02047069 [Brassica cretica]